MVKQIVRIFKKWEKERIKEEIKRVHIGYSDEAIGIKGI